jgi:hypothetical protein
MSETTEPTHLTEPPAPVTSDEIWAELRKSASKQERP